MKHTPGPWKVRFINPNDEDSSFFVEAKNNNMPELGYGIEILGDDYGDHNGYPHKQRLADAKLISAATELLEALIHCKDALKAVNSFGATKPFIDAAEAAIKKAKS